MNPSETRFLEQLTVLKLVSVQQHYADLATEAAQKGIGSDWCTQEFGADYHSRNAFYAEIGRTGKIPAGVVAAGVPARVIGTTEQYMKKAEAESLPLRVPCRSSADERQQLVELLMTPDGAQD